jgi:hypothetical protein
MSHTVSIKAQVKCQTALAATCLRLGLPAPHPRTGPLVRPDRHRHRRATARLAIPPCITSDGSVLHDHFQGLWGEPKELSRFLQAYATEAAKFWLLSCHFEPRLSPNSLYPLMDSQTIPPGPGGPGHL